MRITKDFSADCFTPVVKYVELYALFYIHSTEETIYLEIIFLNKTVPLTLNTIPTYILNVEKIYHYHGFLQIHGTWHNEIERIAIVIT